MRVPVTELTGLAFLDNFARRGIPVVITGAHQKDTNWTRRRDALKELNPANDEFVHAGEPGVSRYCMSPKCGEAGQLYLDAFSPAFDLPRVLPKIMFDKASPFFGRTGDLFAIDAYHPLHFDLTCNGIISVQYTGRKKWYLFSPSAWEIPLVDGTKLQPHTPLETVLTEGDILFFMPGWFHATEILEGPSIAASHHTTAPIYGAINPADMQVSPFGYAKCYHDRYGWKMADKFWAAMRKQGNVSQTEPLKPEYVPNAKNLQIVDALLTPAMVSRTASKRRSEREEAGAGKNLGIDAHKEL